MLECPDCHGTLDWDIIKRKKGHIETAEAHCSRCEVVYLVRDGIGIFLASDLPRNDLWEETEDHLTQYFRCYPKAKKQLMETPLKALNPADQFFRAQLLEKEGKYSEAKEVEEIATKRLYTQAYLDCWESQVAYLLGMLSLSEEPVVDLASGRGHLVEKLVSSTERPIVVTDFSPQVLRRDRQRFEFFDFYDRVSLLAVDARRTPFRDGTVSTMTTNMGLPNTENPGKLLHELQRIVSGEFLVVSQFYSEKDETNASLINEAGLDKLLFRDSALKAFKDADWRVEIANLCKAEARPTPESEIIEGARIDGLPVEETVLEWCVLVASKER